MRYLLRNALEAQGQGGRLRRLARWPRRRLAARPPSRRVLDRPAGALATTLVVTVAVVAFVLAHSPAVGVATPQATVRDFLLAGVVNKDGYTACRYLTPRARVSFEGHWPPHPSCQIFFSGAGLTLGGLQLQSERALKQLTYRVVPVGTARRVVVSHGGGSIAFTLRPGTEPELAEGQNPPTPWRIDSSVARLGARAAATQPEEPAN